MPIEPAVPGSSDGPTSIDALVAAAGLDPGGGVQVVPAARCAGADAALATIRAGGGRRRPVGAAGEVPA